MYIIGTTYCLRRVRNVFLMTPEVDTNNDHNNNGVHIIYVVCISRAACTHVCSGLSVCLSVHSSCREFAELVLVRTVSTTAVILIGPVLLLLYLYVFLPVISLNYRLLISYFSMISYDSSFFEKNI